MKEFTWYRLNDEYGVVATGWECPSCENNHDWVFFNEVGEELTCEECGEISVSPPEMLW